MMINKMFDNSKMAVMTDDDFTESNQKLSAEEFKAVIPKQIRDRITTKVMERINQILADQKIREHFRDNLLSYTNVLQTGKYKLSSYIDAVKYVSFKLLGYNNQESYGRTFPDRYNLLVSEGGTEKSISAYVAAYNRNKLVNAIWEQTLIPSYVLNADLYQRAINTQAELMINSKSDKVRSSAADSILYHLKQPEVTKLKMDIGVKDDKTIQELRATTLELAAMQKKMIMSGVMSAEDVAHSKLVIEHQS
jgi:hypothetical protein